MSNLIVPFILLLAIAAMTHISFKALLKKTDKQDKQDKHQDDRNIHHEKFSEIFSIMTDIESKCETEDKAPIMMFKMKIKEFLELVKEDTYWYENPFYDVNEMFQQADFFFTQHNYSDKKSLLRFPKIPF